MAVTQMEQFIRDYAASIGLNPDVVMRTVLSEGGQQSLEPAGYARQSLVQGPHGQEPSFGSFQMYMAPGALGDRALKAGADPRNPADAFKVAKFAMDTMKTEGLGAWHGWKGDPWAARMSGGTGANVPIPGYNAGPDGPKGQEHYAQPFTPPDGPKGQEAWSPPAGGPATIGENVASQSPYSLPAGKKENALASMAKMAMNSPGQSWQMPQIEPTPGAARVDQPAVPVLDPQAAAQRQQLVQMMLARLNQGSLV